MIPKWIWGPRHPWYLLCLIIIDAKMDISRRILVQYPFVLASINMGWREYQSSNCISNRQVGLENCNQPRGVCAYTKAKLSAYRVPIFLSCRPRVPICLPHQCQKGYPAGNNVLFHIFHTTLTKNRIFCKFWTFRIFSVRFKMWILNFLEEKTWK